VYYEHYADQLGRVWEVVQEPSLQRSDDTSCGVFTAYNVQRILDGIRGRYSPLIGFPVRYLRHKLASCIRNNHREMMEDKHTRRLFEDFESKHGDILKRGRDMGNMTTGMAAARGDS